MQPFLDEPDTDMQTSAVSVLPVGLMTHEQGRMVECMSNMKGGSLG
jgi:hypothetical protein